MDERKSPHGDGYCQNMIHCTLPYPCCPSDEICTEPVLVVLLKVYMIAPIVVLDIIAYWYHILASLMVLHLDSRKVIPWAF